jgi:hypothetical protein
MPNELDSMPEELNTVRTIHGKACYTLLNHTLLVKPINMKIILAVIVVIISLFIWYGESRKFFKLTNGEYVTLWKTYNNTSFIVHGKYYGLLPPSGNHIRTSNINSLSIYMRRDKIDTIYFNSLSNYSVSNIEIAEPIMIDIKTSTNQDARIFLEKVPHRVFESWCKLRFDVRENYAVDENGIIQK